MITEHKCPHCGLKIALDIGQQMHEKCPSCGVVLNPNYDKDLKVLKDDGPTLTEWIDNGNKAVDYPPQEFRAKPLTKADMIRIDEMSAAEDELNEINEAQNEDKE